MIVIDTNVIDKRAPTDPAVEMLVALGRATSHTLYLPAVAWEEYSAHVRRELDTAYQALLEKGRDLETLAPHWRFEVPGSPAETAAREQNTKLHERFTPIPTPAGAPAEGLRREIQRQAPAGDGAGARDTAIWLTALEQMARCESAEELLIFYSKNVKDFADGKSGRIHPSLAADTAIHLGDSADRFRYCADFESLLRVLDATPMTVDDSHRALAVDSTVLREAMVSTLLHPNLFFALSMPWSRGLGDLSSGGIDKLGLEAWRNPHRLQVQGIDYLVFSGTWSGEKLFTVANPQPGDTVTNVLVTFKVDATIVAELDEQGYIAAVNVDGLTVPRELHATHVSQIFSSM